MSLIADLIRAGVDPDLVARVADEMAEARAQGAASAIPARTARQDRNHRYYERKKEERLKASESRLNPSEQDHSDGVHVEQKEMLPTPLERKTPPPPKENPPKGGQKKGSRLPTDWQPSADEIDYGRALGLTENQIWGMAEDMRLWAASAPGQKGVKLDWPSTFKGWMRREAQKSRASPRRPNGSLMAEIAGGSLRGSTDEQYPGEYQSSPSPRTAKPALFGFDSDVPEPLGNDGGGPLLDLRRSDAGWY